MEEQLIASIFEKGLIAGAFVFMLYYFMTKFSKTLEDVSFTLSNMNAVISNMNDRMGRLEAQQERRNKDDGIE